MLAYLLLPFLVSPSITLAADSPVGNWLFYKKIYRGNEMPEPPEATLRLHFDFRPDGTDRLYWWHEGEDDNCSRDGTYVVNGGEITDTVVKVDPNNHPNCAKDPDMQEGKVAKIPFALVNDELHTTVPLGDEKLIYVWRRQP